MGKINVEKDSVRVALNTYNTAMSTLENAINDYKNVVSIMEQNKSEYCRNMGKAMETAIDDHGKDLLKSAKIFSDEVKSFRSYRKYFCNDINFIKVD